MNDEKLYHDFESDDYEEGSDIEELDSDKEESLAHQELGQWLDQLQTLSNELDGVRPSAAFSMDQKKQTGEDLKFEQISSSSSNVVAVSQQQQVVKPKVKPAVPPKPPLDAYRYSMVNMEDSADVDLDALLGELCALESQLNSNGPDSLFGKWTSKKPTSSSASTPTTASNNNLQPPKPKRVTSVQKNVDVDKMNVIVDHQQQQHAVATTATAATTKILPQEVLQCRAQSPDNDSAFCDSASLTSSESILSSSHRSRDSNGSSADSTRGSMTTPSPTQLLETVQAQIRNVQEEIKNENLSEEERNARIKAEKIKIALEKMKEASVKKLYIKVFSSDGSSKSILVDERWTVGYILKHLAEKNHMPLTARHALVECYPDLFMERIYEDHEYVVENISMWTRDSPNKLFFVDRPDKFDMFHNPHLYLLNETNSSNKNVYDMTAKQQMITEFFEPSHVQPPEIAGILYLKSDGKKSWKKHYFVLRASGLYYVPKGKTKSSKDLVCLMQLDMVQVYNGIGWKKKYKAPTEYGFALKHPRIQVKASKFVKYLCVDDERTYQRWLTGLRLAKYGRQLLDNFVEVSNYVDNDVTPTSSNSEYCRESVVMRPKNSAASGSINRNSTSSNRSSSDVLMNGASKRNSRTLMHVDLPSIPSTGACDSVEYRRHMVASPTSNRTVVNSYDSTNGSDSQTPTPETQSMNGFEADFTTGTIKRQPTPTSTTTASSAKIGGSARMPLTDGARQIHSATSRSLLYQNNCDSISLSGAESRASGEEEADSDEELPPPPSELQLMASHQHAYEFPPPPSPVKTPSSTSSPMHQNVPNMMFPLREQTSRSSPRMTSSFTTTTSARDRHSSSTDNNEVLRKSTPSVDGHGYGPTTALIVNTRSSRSSIDSQADVCDSDSVKSKFKRLPPAPPKRSENTRLSTTSVNSPVSPGAVSMQSSDRERTSTSSNHLESQCSPCNGVAVLPTVRPKPVVPVKPKLPANLTASPAGGIHHHQNASPVRHSPGPVPSIPAATDAFNDELQKMLQRRLQKMQDDETPTSTNADQKFT